MISWMLTVNRLTWITKLTEVMLYLENDHVLFVSLAQNKAHTPIPTAHIGSIKNTYTII